MFVDSIACFEKCLKMFEKLWADMLLKYDKEKDNLVSILLVLYLIQYCHGKKES